MIGQDRPALTDVEITPEMIEAGCAALARFIPDATDLADPELVRSGVRAIYESMSSLSGVRDTV